MDTSLQKKFDRLENTRSVLLMMVKDVEERKIYHKTTPEKWSIVQTLAHMVDAEQQSVSYMNKKIRASLALPRTGIGSLLKSVFLKVMMRLPLKYRAPKVLRESPNEQSIHQLEMEWDKVRADLQRLLDSLPKELLNRDFFKHPFTGYMNIYHALDFMQDHFNRHMRQIEQKVLEAEKR